MQQEKSSIYFNAGRESIIENVTSVNLRKQEEALQMLDKLPDGNTLCHGYFHLGNILIGRC